MIDSKKLDDALMFAQAEMEVWNKRFTEEWGRSSQATMMKGLYGMVPADVKEQIKTMDPNGFASLNDVINGKGRSK